MTLTRLRGFQDLFGAHAAAFSRIEQCARRIMVRYAVGEIRLPLLERIELYQRSTGETSDVVEKQMYAFADRDEAETLRVAPARPVAVLPITAAAGTTVALRPEGTPSVVRAYIEAGLDRSDPEQRFFYSGPMFRRERPQKGRYRQFYQFGVEVFGRADAATDAELLIMLDDLRRELGLELTTEVNSLGCSECRPVYRKLLLEYGRAHLGELCKDCHARLERNPLRLLDCKIDVKLAEAAPKPLDHLCDACRKHFDIVVDLIAKAGVAHVVNPRIVRGLDYYTRTAFEVTSTAVGSQSAVAAGGRYDGLVEALGGAPVPGTGFAIGIDRMTLALEAARAAVPPGATVAIITMGDDAMRRGMALAHDLRGRGVNVAMLSPERGLKALLKRADRIGATHAVIIGPDELARDAAQLRDLKESQQREVKLDAIAVALDASDKKDPP